MNILRGEKTNSLMIMLFVVAVEESPEERP
jgi:hypothetical protein